MEIQSLKLFLTDGDLAVLLALAPPPGEPIEELKAGFTPEGVIVSGRYPTPFFPVAFETAWQVEGAGPEVRARLASVRVLGLPGNVLGGALMKMIRDAVEGKPGIRVENDAVVIHVGQVAKAHGIDLTVNFTTVRLSVGAAVIEAGAVA